MHSRDGSLGFVSQTNNHHNNMRRSTDEAAESAPTSSHAVTRSTSPISEHVVSSILQEDGLVNDDDFTIHIKSIQGGILDPNQPFESNPKDQEYYTKYLRQRLRDILLDRNDASSDSSGEDRDVEVTDYEELNTSEERGRLRGRGSRRNYGGGSRTSNNYAERKYLRSKEDYSHSRCNSRRSSRSRGGGSRSRSASCSRGGGGATEELMQSMAQIMTAVGSIVTKKQRNPYKSVLRKHARRQRQQEQQYGHQQQEQEQGHYQNGYNTGHSYAGGNVVLQPPGQSSSAYSRYSTSANPSIASPALSGLVALGGPLSRASSRQDAHAAAVGMVGVPRTRAEMIDAIMAKLQVNLL